MENKPSFHLKQRDHLAAAVCAAGSSGNIDVKKHSCAAIVSPQHTISDLIFQSHFADEWLVTIENYFARPRRTTLPLN